MLTVKEVIQWLTTHWTVTEKDFDEFVTIILESPPEALFETDHFTRSIPTRWLHLACYAKKKRTRLKYRRRIQRLAEEWTDEE